MQIRGKFIEINAVDGTKIRLANDQFLRARNAANTTDVNVIRVNSSDQVEVPSALLLKTSAIFEDPAAGTNAITVAAPSGLGSSYTLQLPPNTGSSGQVLQTDGAGVTSWVTPSSSGEANTASNLGSGAGVFANKTGVDLRFRSLVQGPGVTITQNTNDITISATGTGEANTASNVGLGAGVFRAKTGVDLEFKSLIGTQGITITNNANDLTFSLPGTTKGDLLVHNGTTLIRVGVGPDGHILEADSATASGVRWASPGGGGGGATRALDNLLTTSINRALIFQLPATGTRYNVPTVGDLDISRIYETNTKSLDPQDFSISAGGQLWDGAWSGAAPNTGTLGLLGGSFIVQSGASGTLGGAINTQSFSLGGGNVSFGNSLDLTAQNISAINVSGMSIRCADINLVMPLGSTVGDIDQGAHQIRIGDVGIGEDVTVSSINSSGSSFDIATGNIVSAGPNSTVSGGLFTHQLKLYTGTIDSGVIVSTPLSGATGAIDIRTGDNSALNGGGTGLVNLGTGRVRGDNSGSRPTSGPVQIFTGDAASLGGTHGDTGTINITTGSAVGAGLSGTVFIGTGGADTPNQRGTIILEAEKIEPSGSLAAWKTFVLEPSALTAVTNVESVGAFFLPERASIELVLIRNEIPFAGPGLTSFTLELGVVGDLDKYTTAYDCFAPSDDTTQQVSAHNGLIPLWGAQEDIQVTARANAGFNLSTLTAGRAILSVKYAVVPRY